MGYPRSIFNIIGNEFCERFSYYGLRTALPFYLRTFSGVDETRATSLYAVFTTFAYLFPLMGGILSDSYLGKYKTILYLSLVYCLGNLVNAFFSLPSMFPEVGRAVGCALGLLLVAIGTGGIKPCVSAFGGDQFVQGQEKELASFFFVFYFSINSGSVLATLSTPVLRKDVECFGSNCYFLAFGIPAILMVVAVMFFIAGHKKYRIIPPQGSVIVDVFKVVSTALKRKFSSSSASSPTSLSPSSPTDEKTDLLVEKKHWLDYARGIHSDELIEDCKGLMEVLYIFIPIPIFWSLFDQQSTRWTFQADKMNRMTPFNNYEIAPDQIQVFNSFLVLLNVPFFNRVIYRHVKLSLLRRMTIGMFLAGTSFVASAIVEYLNNSSQISVFWQLPQYLLMVWGEIMVSITGLEYAYSQAPPSMKAVCQAAWLMTISVGNIVVLIVAETRLFEQAIEFFVFAGLMFATTVLFAFMSTRVKMREVDMRQSQTEASTEALLDGDKDKDYP